MDAKEKRIRKTLRLLIIAGVVMAVLAVVLGLLGFSGNTLKDTAEPAAEAVPETVLETVAETVPETAPETVALDSAAQSESVAPEATSEAVVTEDTAGANTVEEQRTDSDENDLNRNASDESAAANQEAEQMVQLINKSEDQETEQKKTVLPFLRMACRIVSCTLIVLVIVDGFLIALIVKNVKEHQRKVRTKPEIYATTQVSAGVPTVAPSAPPRQEIPPTSIIPGITMGKAHSIGKRDYQQDSFGQTPILGKQGVLAILADGMGGLENGEKVSQQVVIGGLNFGAALNRIGTVNPLTDMLDAINRSVNQMLGPEGLYKSGSTMVSVLVADGFAHWISVGDSRIYLFRDRYLSQVTQDHDLLQRWMPDILADRRSLDEALKNMDGRKLTSFIGMGDIQHIDQSRMPLRLQPGDRLLLMSDGIYGSISDAEMENLLRNSSNVQTVAAQIEQRVSQAALPYQDNYTLLILGYDPAV